MTKYTVTYKVGTRRWYLNSWWGKKLHREDGPACEFANGDKWWYLNDELHREDGPAIEWADGGSWWFLEGKRVTEELHKKLTSKPYCQGKVVEIDGIKYELKEV